MKITQNLPFRQGSTVHVKLHDTRIVQADVILISNTVSGVKVRILSDRLLLTVDPEQVLQVVKY